MKKIVCNVCGSEKYKNLFLGRDRLLAIDSKTFQVVRCSQCGLTYLNPQPTADELRIYYPETYGPYGNTGTIFHYGAMAAALRKIYHGIRSLFPRAKKSVKEGGAKEDERISYLDFGCGGGLQLEAVRKDHPNWDLYGLDNNPVACERTEAKGFKVFCGELSEVSLPEKFFDRVNMSHVIEHVNDPKQTLAVLGRSIKKGGIIVIATPNIRSFSAKIFGSYWYALDTPRHLFLFNAKTLGRILKDAGFTVKKVDYDKGPKVFVRSLFYVMGRKDMMISPLLWRSLSLFSRFAAHLGMTSIMTVYAEKE
ncbi:methyltransferase domain-containing protein [Patescibacteria group bacterium]|nr:methyltransferase domain-containing protein [Patescibacteria group bacterium]